MKTWIYLINNFAHDLFTGIWFGCLVGIYTVHKETSDHAMQSMADIHLNLLQIFFRLGAVALALVMLTGVVRFMYRRDWDTFENSVAAAKKPLLIVKHAVLGIAFCLGSFLAYRWVF